MFTTDIKGPASVRLADGTIMTRADLPPISTKRWVASRKAAVVAAVVEGLLSRNEAIKLYALSEEELDSWVQSNQRFGQAALKVTHLKKHRQPKRE